MHQISIFSFHFLGLILKNRHQTQVGIVLIAREKHEGCFSFPTSVVNQEKQETRTNET